MNSVFDIRRNCVRIKADIKGTGVKFRGSGVLYPLGTDVYYDYVLTAQHILKDAKKEKLSTQLEKITAIEIEISENGYFTTYRTIAKDNIEDSLLLVGEDFLIIKIDKGEKQFEPFYLADDLIEEKPMYLYGISSEAQDYLNWLKANRKVMNAGKMKLERVEKFRKLLEMTEQYRRKNQYE